MIFDGTEINLLIAFAAGVITFFASCLLPLVPTYLAYLAGSAKKSEKELPFYKRQMFINGLFFTLGFIMIFVVLGATANTLGSLLSVHRGSIQKIGGLFFIILGLFMLDVIKPMLLLKEHRLTAKLPHTKFKKLNALIVGITFGFAWTPCIGPVLGVILFWASQANSLLKGMGLLLTYGIGMGIPFLIVAAVLDQFQGKLENFNKLGNTLQKVSAIFIIFIGVLMLIGRVDLFVHNMVNILNLQHLAK